MLKRLLGLRKTKEELEREAEHKKELEARVAFEKGVSTIKDLIAPPSMQVLPGYLLLGDLYTRTYFVIDYPRYLFTEWISPVVNLDMTMDVALHILPVESRKVMDRLKVTVARMEAQYSEMQEKGLVRDPQLETQYRDAEELRDRLQSGEEKLFQLGLYFTLYAHDLKTLDENAKRLETALGSQLVLTRPATLQMEQGLNSTLPLAYDEIGVLRNMDTDALSTMFPFVSSELTSDEGILYGLNRHTNGLVIWDRFNLENANSVIFAKSGSGKSYAVKLEALRSLMLGTEVIIIDPENEYQELAKAVGGSYLPLSITSDKRLNPFDLPVLKDEQDKKDALRSNIIILSGLLNLMLGKLTPKESNLLDRALIEAYSIKGITADPSTHHLEPPLMSDLEETLNSLEGGADMAEKLRKFTTGTFSGIFNQPTNVELENPFVVFNIRDLEDELRPVAMYIILHYIWGRIRQDIKRRILVVDEAWTMMKHEDSAQFLFGIAKRARKYYLGLTTITQDVEDFLRNKYGKAIVTNSSLTLLLRQHPAAVDAVVETFNLTEAEKYLLLNAEVGEGLFFAGSNHVALQVISSYNEHQLVTSKPQEIAEMKKEKL